MIPTALSVCGCEASSSWWCHPHSHSTELALHSASIGSTMILQWSFGVSKIYTNTVHALIYETMCEYFLHSSLCKFPLHTRPTAANLWWEPQTMKIITSFSTQLLSSFVENSVSSWKFRLLSYSINPVTSNGEGWKKFSIQPSHKSGWRCSETEVSIPVSWHP